MYIHIYTHIDLPALRHAKRLRELAQQARRARLNEERKDRRPLRDAVNGGRQVSGVRLVSRVRRRRPRAAPA